MLKNFRYGRNVEDLIAHRRCEAKYILDSEDAVLLFENANRKQDNATYVMIHYNFPEGRVNDWLQKRFVFGNMEEEMIRSHNLLMVQGGYNHIKNTAYSHNSLYDYKKRKWIVKPGIWSNIVRTSDDITREGRRVDFIEEHDCFIAYNNVEGKLHFSILNPDGTVRNNSSYNHNEIKKILIKNKL